RQRQLEKSIAAISKAVELQPDSAKYRNNLAAALIDAGRPDDALQQLKATTTEAVAEYNIGYLLQQKGDKAQSQRHFVRALSLDPGLKPARDMLAQLGVQPIQEQVAAAAAENRVPAVVTTAPAPSESVAAYASGTAEQRIYTSAPHVKTAAAAPS